VPGIMRSHGLWFREGRWWYIAGGDEYHFWLGRVEMNPAFIAPFLFIAFLFQFGFWVIKAGGVGIGFWLGCGGRWRGGSAAGVAGRGGCDGT
jgi:hypothetical protein